MNSRLEFRLAAHVHSTWSYDGSLSLDEIARLFARVGYDGVLLSEHDLGWGGRRWDAFRQACAASSTERLTLVPGIEYSDAENAAHVLVWGCDDFLGAGLATEVLLSRLAECERGVSVLAHPGRRGIASRLPDEVLRRFDGIEVWNRKYDGVQPDDTARDLAARLGLPSFVGLDLHTRRQLFPLSLLVEVDPGLPALEAIEDALLEGRVDCRALGSPLPRLLSPAGRALLGGGERARRAGAVAVRRFSQARAGARR